MVVVAVVGETKATLELEFREDEGETVVGETAVSMAATTVRGEDAREMEEGEAEEEEMMGQPRCANSPTNPGLGCGAKSKVLNSSMLGPEKAYSVPA